MHGALELRAAPRGAAAVDDDHGEALVGEPLAGEVRAARGDHPLGVRAAVGVHQHRQPGAGLVAGRQQQRGGQRGGRPTASSVTRGTQAGRLRRATRLVVPTPRARSTVVVAPSTCRGPAGRRAACRRAAGRRARRRRRAAREAARRAHVHSPTAPGSRSPLNSTVSPSTSSTARTCRDGGVTGLPVDDQPARAVGVGHGDQRARRRCARARRGRCRPRPGRCCSWSRRGGPGRRVDAQRPQRPLVARLDDDEQPVARPRPPSARYSSRRRPSGPGSAAPSRATSSSVDPRVRRARRRVGDDRRAAGRGARGRRCASAAPGSSSTRATSSASPAGRPPVAAHPVHLLGGDELGEPVAHLRAVRRGERGRHPLVRSWTCSAPPLT